MVGQLLAITDISTTALWGGCFLKLGVVADEIILKPPNPSSVYHTPLDYNF